MDVRSLTVAMAMLSVSTTAFADPAKAPVHKADQPANQAPSVEIASADDAATDVATEQQPAADPAKPVRHARVTTCRCGDQTNPGNN